MVARSRYGAAAAGSRWPGSRDPAGSRWPGSRDPAGSRWPGARRRAGRALLAGWVAALALTLALLAGCSHGSDVTEVTVQAGSVTVTLPTALSCTGPTGATALTCSGGENDDDAPHLTLAPGTPLDISVPTEVGNTPWVIVFSYQDAQGERQSDRTAVFPAKERYSYHLVPPEGAQLTRLEVQSITAAQGPDGGVEFPATHTWVLVIDPADGTG